MKKISFILLLVCCYFIAYSQSDFKIKNGPYLQMVGESEATIIWTTTGDAVSWVEIAPDDGSHFYAQQRPRYYQAAFGRKAIGTLHKVTVKNLEKGTSYRYRIYSKEVMKLSPYYVQYGKVAANDVYRGKPYRFTTLDKSKPTLKFRVINDIHEDNELLHALLEGTKELNPDFVFFNGDMLSTMNSEEQLFKGFMDGAIKEFATDIPLFQSRGNHEARGNFSPEFICYFPTNTGAPYYMFKAGSVCFLVLDGGEDKPDSDKEYWDLADFDRYREEQTEWLKKIVQEEEYKNAQYRIVFLHVPPLAGKTSWHGSIHLQKLFLPILNEANVDIMLCAHLHRHLYHPAGEEGCNFPIIINSNKDVMDVEVTEKEIKVEIHNHKKENIGKWTFNKK